MSVGGEAEPGNQRKKKLRKRLPSNWEEVGRVKPNIGRERDTERQLRTVATRGVVQLFNAVRLHQAESPAIGDFPKSKRRLGGGDDDDGEFSVDKLTKRSTKAKTANAKVKAEFEPLTMKRESETPMPTAPLSNSNCSKWAVLRDDYLTAPAMQLMRDWDKSISRSEGSDSGGGGE